MYLVIGLGNPGDEYENTRHNAGFMVVDALAGGAGANYWKNECGSATAKGALAGSDVVFAKPQSYMNLSGGPVRLLCQAYEVDLAHIIVIHDDLDIEPGRIRVKRGGGSAGHNGLKSITEKLGSPDYFRVRVGIGRPPGRMPSADFVLAPLRKGDLDDFTQGCILAARAVPYLVEHGLEATQQEFN